MVTECLAAALLFLYVKSRMNIRHAIKELKELNAQDSNQRLKLHSPDGSVETLLCEINGLLEQKQQQAIAYEAKERDLRKQIANISHDLRTPLTSIIGYTQLLRDDRVTAEEKMEYVDIIESKAQTLQTLITSFYDLSRLEANELDFQLEPVSLHTILCNVLVAFYQDITGKGIEMELDLEENLPPVIADRNAVTRIFTNLFQNAFRHGRSRIRVSQKMTDHRIVTAVENDTDEIAPEDMEHIFDRFFTSDRMRTGQNTGLGLTIVKKLVEGLGGQITAGLEEDRFCIHITWVNLLKG
ncbi:sensor histidine kinase [Lachnotalea sp. AF33-28]|jgi:signal transduction histidine kinase|uniref:sensor histidine kinase n=1 Tax=Lachnotalea sp. AF33-28 TaxID=2292046 RepID=UPI001FAAADEC|nr:HAMP domain-containing sensor histidine kinase [Lachnotalea sp. AF33-28]